MEKGSRRIRPRYLALVAGLFAIVALFLFFKGPREKKAPQEGKVKLEATHPQPPPPRVTTKEVSPPQPQEGTPQVQKEIPPSPPQTKVESTPAPEEKRIVEEKIEVVLFPGQRPQHVERALKEKGIDFQKARKETTTTMWRVIVKASSPEGDLEYRKLKQAMGVTPWKFKRGGSLYLVVASLKDEKKARALVENLKSAGFNSLSSPVTKRVNLEVFSFTVKKAEWPTLKSLLESLGAQVLEEKPLDHKTSLSQPTSTTSQGKDSSSPLSR